MTVPIRDKQKHIAAGGGERSIMPTRLVDFRDNADQIIDALVPNILKVLWLMARYRCVIAPATRILLPGKVRIGRGTVIRGGVITAKSGDDVGIRIGRGVLIQPYVSLHSRGDRIAIDDRVGINSFCYIDGHGGVSIGHDTLLGPGVRIVGNYNTESTAASWIAAGTTRAGVTIGANCWIGANAVIVDGVSIADGCVVGAGAVVTQDLPERAVAMGVPARVVRTRPAPS